MNYPRKADAGPASARGGHIDVASHNALRYNSGGFLTLSVSAPLKQTK